MRRRRPDPSLPRSDHNSTVDDEMTESNLAANIDWSELMATFPQGPQTSLSMPTTPGQNPTPCFSTLSSSAGFTESPVDQQTNTNFCPSLFQGGRPRPCEPSWSDANLPWLPSNTLADSRLHTTQPSSALPASNSNQMRMQNHPSYSAPSLFAPQISEQASSSGWTSACGSPLQSPAVQPQSRVGSPRMLDSNSESQRRPTQTTMVLDDLDPATMASMMQILRQSQTRATITMNS